MMRIKISTEFPALIIEMLEYKKSSNNNEEVINLSSKYITDTRIDIKKQV
jgi:hypothetical protein